MSSWGYCDFAEFRKFAADMDNLAYDLHTMELTLLQELAERALRKVVQRTPVGVKPTFDEADTIKLKGQKSRQHPHGRTFRFLTKSGAIKEKYWSGYVGGNLRRSWQVGNIVRKDGSWEVEVCNTAEYASYVEYGHRQQPSRYVPALGKRLKAGWVQGHFMLTITEEELRMQAPAIIEKRMQQFFKERIG